MLQLRSTSKVARRYLAICILGVALVLGPARTQAQDVAQAASVALFRLAIELARSVADISYQSIGVDRRLGNVSLLGLRIQTPIGPVDVGEISASASGGWADLATTQQRSAFDAQDIQVPLWLTDLPRPIIDMLTVGPDPVLRADLLARSNYDLPSGAVDGHVTTELAGLAHVELTAGLRGLHLDLGNFAPAGVVERIDLFIADRGLVGRALRAFAADQGVDEASVRRLAVEALRHKLESVLFDPDAPVENRSGAIAATQVQINEAVRAVDAFLQGGRTLHLSLRPQTPLSFGEIAQAIGVRRIGELGLSIGTEPPAAPGAPLAEAGLASSVDPVLLTERARAYLEGHGVPQNFAKAAELARRAAEAGAPEGQFIQARLLVNGNDPMARRDAYSLALLAAARGVQDARALVAELETTMSAADIVTTQATAMSAFMEMPEARALAARRQAAMNGDLAAMQDLAQWFRSGARAPKSYKDAYVWASLAAARGDAISASVRDAIAQASQRGILPTGLLSDGQAEAERLWQTIPAAPR